MCRMKFSDMLMSHDTHMNESWHTCEWVMTHIRTSHDTHVNESWHTYEYQTHTQTKRDIIERCNSLCVTCLISHIWVSLDTHMCVRHTYVCQTHICVSDTHTNKTRHHREMQHNMCHMPYFTHLKVGHFCDKVRHSCTKWHLCNKVRHSCNKVRHLCNKVRRVHTCDMTPSNTWHDSFICVPWLIPMCGMTSAHMWHDSFVCVPWPLQIYDMPHSYVWYDSFIQ